MRFSLPDILSLARIPCAAAVIVLYSGRDKARFEAAIAVILVALATDFLDGALARRRGISSKHGYIVDGLGDRAMYIALALAFLVQQKIGLLATWMLIVREVAIYAVRLFSDHWLDANKSVRFLSRLHAGLIRIWILSVLAGDGAQLYAPMWIPKLQGISTMQNVLLLVTLAMSYYSLWRHLKVILAASDS